MEAPPLPHESVRKRMDKDTAGPLEPPVANSGSRLLARYLTREFLSSDTVPKVDVEASRAAPTARYEAVVVLV
jgi:hypothetical protein